VGASTVGVGALETCSGVAVVAGSVESTEDSRGSSTLTRSLYPEDRVEAQVERDQDTREEYA
jgi:hypothetical protein